MKTKEELEKVRAELEDELGHQVTPNFVAGYIDGVECADSDKEYKFDPDSDYGKGFTMAIEQIEDDFYFESDDFETPDDDPGFDQMFLL